MFQSLNPLQTYSRNPNQSDAGESENVPTLSESQIKLQRSSKIVNWILFALIIILLAVLFLTVGLAFHGYLVENGILSKGDADEETVEKSVHREIEIDKVVLNGTEEGSVVSNVTTTVTEIITETIQEIHIKKPIEVKGCEGCLSFEELKRRAEFSIQDAEKYIHDTVSAVILPEKDKVDVNLAVSIEDFSNQLTNLPDLKKSIEKLVSLNKTFTDAFKEALVSQARTRKLEEEFQQNVLKIEDLKKEVVDYIQRTYNLAKTKDDWEKAIDILNNEIAQKKQEFNAEGERLKENIKLIEQRLLNLLHEVGAKSLGGLEGLIDSKQKTIDNIGGKIVECQTVLPSYRKKIIDLAQQQKTLVTRLEEVVTQINQLDWVDHVLQTIRGFENIKNSLKTIRAEQLEKGRENLEVLLHDLEAKEANLTQLLISQPELKVTRSFERETEEKIEQGSITTTIHKSYQEVTTTDYAEALYKTIQKEQNLLKVWASEQFNTFNISTNEIKNITNTIENLEASIQGRTADFTKYATEKTEIETKIKRIRIELETEQKEARTCEGLVENSEEQAEKFKEELRQLQETLVRAKLLNKEKEQEQDNLTTKRDEHQREIDEKQSQLANIKKKISETDENKHLTEDHLEALTLSINEKIATGPKTEVIERKFRDNQKKIQNAKRLYEELSLLIESVKRIA